MAEGRRRAAEREAKARARLALGLAKASPQETPAVPAAKSMMGPQPQGQPSLQKSFARKRAAESKDGGIQNQQSTINNQQSTINNQQSTINNQQSTINKQAAQVPRIFGGSRSRGRAEHVLPDKGLDRPRARRRLHKPHPPRKDPRGRAGGPQRHPQGLPGLRGLRARRLARAPDPAARRRMLDGLGRARAEQAFNESKSRRGLGRGLLGSLREILERLGVLRWDWALGRRPPACQAPIPHFSLITQSRQPHSWSEHVQHQRSIFFERWKANNPFTPAATVADFTYAFEIRPLCPRCNGASHRWKNQKTGIKKCTSVKNKVACGHEFHHSLTVEGSWSARTYDEQLKTFLSSKNWEAERAWNDIFWAELGNAVRKEAAASSFRESLRYLEMHAEDVTTLCKSCAGKKNRKYIAINNAKGQAMPK